MSAIALDRSVFTVSIPSIETKKFKQLIKLMGWTATAAPARARDNLALRVDRMAESGHFDSKNTTGTNVAVMRV